jgi:subtilisin-like proprotein convertase family protein
MFNFMRWRSLIWPAAVAVVLAVLAALWWQSRSETASRRSAVKQPNTSRAETAASQAVKKAGQVAAQNQSQKANSFRFLSQPASEAPDPVSTKPKDKFKYRLTNTPKPIGDLVHNDRAILLENALFDTTASFDKLAIPASLSAIGDPGAYIVQSKSALDDGFRWQIRQLGARIISYIPNNAYLVRATPDAAAQIAGLPQTQTVLPYEPYYKLKSSLLPMAMEGMQLPEGHDLNLLVFPDAQASTLSALSNMNVTVLSQERSPFGQIVRVQPPSRGWTDLAQLQGVQVVEMARPRVRANDLSRVRVGVTTDSTTTTNYLGLTGSNILVNINDTGVDTNHPDLAGRVFVDFPGSGTDTNGHGTHVAGIIASSGGQSMTVTNASGSVMPPTNGQFRGIAPGANLFAMSIDSVFGIGGTENSFGPIFSDQYLQEAAAQTNALISNNSWHYANDNEYDLAAASYDAAVRDALPETMGSQPITYVFAAGNAGGGDDSGGSGSANTVSSPATAKNAITVGAIEQARNITNKTRIPNPPDANDTNGVTTYTTNTPWLNMTDTSNQVASFSSRGNVGINVEGDFGRFKPDVVAPGTFVTSTTEKDHWDQVSYYNPTNYHFDTLPDQQLATNSFIGYAIFVPYNAVQMQIQTFSSDDLRIYVKYPGPASPTNYDIVGTNVLTLPPDAALTPTEATWSYAVENISDHTASYLIQTEMVTTNDLGDYLQVLSNLNDTLGPYYRYESGTSMSAADITGMLALIKEYFEQPPPPYTHPPHTNSPALMKALLINGSRSVDAQYDFAINHKINFQGWGLPNITTMIPTNAEAFSAQPQGSILFFDQDPINALATGQSRSYKLSVSPDASSNPLRVTLVWTDPPGNPVASVKLVNDLDLVVSNNITGDVYYGNDIAPGNNYTFPTDTNGPPNLDVINNVENVFIAPDVDTNFTIYVVARHVNVNAVTAHPNDVVQDYALVISSGDGEVSNALQIVDVPVTTFTNAPFVTDVTNSFPTDPNSYGGILLSQHTGASSPLLGTNTLPLPKYQGQLTIGETNQWHFYMISNGGGADFTNAAFLTFLPPTLSVPRMGVDQNDPNNASRFEGDIDLYVSTDPTLTNLNPAAIDAAFKSVGRGGSETVVLTNREASGKTYYIGVKSEDHEAVEYGFLGVFSNLPFGSEDANGDMHLRGFPAPVPIPDGSPDAPGGVYIFAVCASDLTVKRVVATNVISHEQVNDLFGKLTHNEASDVLNNHSGTGPTTNRVYIYNDSGQTITGSQRSDGPGSLRDFATQPGVGQWMLTMIDNAPGHFGTNIAFSLFLEKQQDLVDGVTVTLNGGECDDEFIFVPVEATNLTVVGTILSGGGPEGVQMTVCPIDASGPDCQTTVITGVTSTNTIVIDKHSNPPLNPGWYSVRICNLNTGIPVTVRIRAFLGLDLAGVQPTIYPAGGPTTILDDAVTTSSILVTNKEKLVSVEVGVRIDHPRVSDLVLTLVGPDGTRVLLDENRGGFTTNGLGLDQFATNIIPVNSTGGPDAVTNTIDTGLTSGTIQIDYDFYTIPDRMTVYYEGNVIWDSGMISGAGTQTITFGPGASTVVTIIMNQGGNGNQSTRWTYTVTSTTAKFFYATFTEDTNKTVTPMKFAIPPFLPQPISILHWANGFEDAEAGVYTTGTSSNGFGNAWQVDAGSVTVLTNGYGPGAAAYEGDHFLELSGDTGQRGTVSTNIGTIPGNDYILSFAYAANPDNSNSQTAVITLGTSNLPPITLISGSNTWDNLNWGVASYPFRAGSASTLIQFAGQDSTNAMLIDYVTIKETSTNLFYLPEDPFGLNHFKKMSAQGNWTLEVWDNRVGAFPTDPPPMLRSWDLSLLFETPIPQPIDLIDNNPSTNVISSGQVQYFRVAVPTWASYATNALTVISGPGVDVWYNQNGKPLTGLGGDQSELAGSTGGNFLLQTNAAPALNLLPGSTYYIAVTNSGGSAATIAFQVNFDVTPLTLDIPITDTEFTNTVPRFFSYDVTTNETGISVQLTNVNGNVDLVARKTPFPNISGPYDYGSFNPGTSDEDIIIYTNSDIPLTAGRWYFGVFNRDTANVNYTIVVTDITGPLPGIIDLTNAIPYPNNNSGIGIPNDYYHFLVTNPVARAQFEINSPTADMTLAVRKGLPPPDLGRHDYISANPGTNDELIILHPWSSPVPLTAGDWYLTAVNVSGAPASYSIKATQWIDAGTNIVVTNINYSGSGFCVTWTSLPGAHYVVQGKVNLNDPTWQDASPTITATNYSTTWCVTPWPSPFHFFRVREGLANTGTVMPVPPGNFSLSRGTNSSSFVLNWTGQPGARYKVQWSPTLTPLVWTTFSNVVTSPDGTFSFKDDGAQSGGMGPARFYRLQQMP